MLYTETFLGAEALTLENDQLRAVVLPGHGGKVASLYYKPKDFELLFQNPHPAFVSASCGDDFSQFEACGFDEAFPTVDACTASVGGRRVDYPDHGEIWSAPFTVTESSDNATALAFQSPLLGYRYHKKLTVEGNSLLCDYSIHNPTVDDIPALWVCHCLVRQEPGLRILLPTEVDTVENVFDSPLLGEAGALLPYPLAQGPQGPVDLSRMPPEGMWKFYARGKVTTGRCGYEYPQSGITATLEYDPHHLPYLGLWATAGGYRGDVNCALEPANGYYDNIDIAEKKGACPLLTAGTHWSLQLRITLEALTV